MSLATRGADLFDGEEIGLLGAKRALRARLIECSQAEIDRQRVLDDLKVALVGPGAILPTRATNQLLIKAEG